MTNPNLDTERLLAAVQANSASPLFVFADALTGIIARRESNLLNAAELELAQPTVQRIETAIQIREYMFRAVGIYRALGEREAPEWLLQDKNDEEDFSEFFQNLTAETELVQAMTDLGNPNLEQLQKTYTAWQKFLAQEKLATAAREKTQVLIDIRACLIGILRYLGQSGSQIQKVIAG